MKLFIIPALLASLAHAWPTAPGSCESGDANPQGSHVAQNALGMVNGGLSAGGYEISIDGTTLKGDETFMFDAGGSLDIKVTADGTSFRGFLLRLSGGDLDDTSDLIVPGENSGDVALCPSTVGNMGHMERSDKTMAAGTLEVPSAQTAPYTLEVTIVGTNNAADGSTWYYDSFKLMTNAADDGGDDETPATSAPTAAPTSPSSKVSASMVMLSSALAAVAGVMFF